MRPDIFSMLHHLHISREIRNRYHIRPSKQVIRLISQTLIFFLQLVQSKLPDIRDQLVMNHCFLSVFISAGVMDVENVDSMMKVNKAATWLTRYKSKFVEKSNTNAAFFRMNVTVSIKTTNHGDVIKWNHFRRYWPLVRGIHRSPVNSPDKGQCHGALIFSLIWANGWVNIRNAGGLRRPLAHYDVTVMAIYGDNPQLSMNPCTWLFAAKCYEMITLCIIAMHNVSNVNIDTSKYWIPNRTFYFISIFIKTQTIDFIGTNGWTSRQMVQYIDWKFLYQTIVAFYGTRK